MGEHERLVLNTQKKYRYYFKDLTGSVDRPLCYVTSLLQLKMVSALLLMTARCALRNYLILCTPFLNSHSLAQICPCISLTTYLHWNRINTFTVP